MGLSKGAFRALFGDTEADPAQSASAGLRPVAENDILTAVDVTLIFRDAVGDWVFGEEIKADRRSVSRILPRGPERSGDTSYERVEYEFSSSRLAKKAADVSATLVVAKMPPGYAVVHRTPLQSYWAKESMARLPEAYDTSDGEDFAARFNPLGFTKANLAARRAASDLEAIAAIAHAERDIYLTKDKIRRASVAGDLVDEVFRDFHPGAIDTRWVRGRSRTATVDAEADDPDEAEAEKDPDTQRLGLVLAPFDTIPTVVAGIIAGLRLFRDETERRIGEGRLRGGRAEVRAAHRLGDHIDDAIEVGVWQALAGADTRRGFEEGRKVADLARLYAGHHLASWNKLLLRQDAVLGRPGALGDDGEPLHGVGAVAATQDEFEAESLYARVEAAETERDRLRLTIEILERFDLGEDNPPERIRNKLRWARRRLARIDGDAAR